MKYSKMSEAALAIEQMNGIALPNNPRPLKVIIASKYVLFPCLDP